MFQIELVDAKISLQSWNDLTEDVIKHCLQSAPSTPLYDVKVAEVIKPGDHIESGFIKTIMKALDGLIRKVTGHLVSWSKIVADAQALSGAFVLSIKDERTSSGI